MKYTNTAAIVCIAKNEENYISEWIYYHLKIGFNQIYIYDNSDNNSLKYLNDIWPSFVVIIPFNNNNNLLKQQNLKSTYLQNDAYNHYIKTHVIFNYNHKWVSFIDCDEFICLKKTTSIIDFLHSKHFESGVLTMNWWFFGSNNNINYLKRPILERFTKKKSKPSEEHKTICVMKDLLPKFTGTGHLPFTKGNYVNSKNEIIKKYDGKTSHPTRDIPLGTFTDPPCVDEIYVAHIFCKSKEEFQNKINRGNCHINNDKSSIKQKRTMQDFYFHDYNDIEDLSLLNILKTPKRNIIYSKNDNQNSLLNLKKDELDIDTYFWDNPDLFENDIISPNSIIEHYSSSGSNENRPFTNLNFPYSDYSKNNEDLIKMSNNELWIHYITFGKKEKRIINLEETNLKETIH